MLKSRNTFFVAASLAIGVSVLTSTKALAQYDFYSSSSFGFNQNNYPPIGQTWAKPSKSSSPKKSAKKPTSTTTQTGRISATNNPLPYTRDRTLSEKIREEFLQDFEKQGMSDDLTDLRAITAQNDIVQIMAGFVRLQGLDSGSMEGLIAFWYGQAWAIANQKPLPTPQQYQGIAEQVKESIAKSPTWNKMSNVERQRFFEQLAYPLFVQKANYQAYLKSGKKDSMAKMASRTQEGLKKIGLDFQNLQLSDEGFSKL
jgi:hypothetical protein